MKTDLLLLAALVFLLVGYIFLTGDTSDTLREAKELQEKVETAAAVQQEISESIEEKEVVPDLEAPELESPDPPPPEFDPLQIELDEDLQRHTWELCQEYGIPFEVVMSIAWHESRLDVEAVGHNANGTQDSGIMQINDINRGWLLEHGLDIDEPMDNIEAGVLMLSLYWEKYPPELALTAYGWGEAGMLRAGEPSSVAQRILEKACEFEGRDDIDDS